MAGSSSETRLLVTDIDNTLFDWVAYYVHAFSALIGKVERLIGVPFAKLAEAPMLPVWLAHLYTKPLFNATLPHRLRELLHVMYWHLPYLSMRDRIYDMTATDAFLDTVGISRPRFQNYGTTLFKFCKDTAWGKRELKAAASSTDKLIAIGS